MRVLELSLRVPAFQPTWPQEHAFWDFLDPVTRL